MRVSIHRFVLNRSQGFTLMELLVVLFIVAILSVIGYQQFQKHLQNGRVQDGTEKLLETASLLERCYSRTSSYQDCNLTFPVASAEGFYSITAETLTATTYRLVATVQSVDATCSQLTLDHTGLRGSDNACW